MATTPRQLETSAVEERVLDIVRELLRELGSHQAAERATLDSSFERDLGLGSLERVELLVRSESRFNLRLPDDIAHQAETPAEWARIILAGGKGATVKPRYRIEQPSREAPVAPASATDWVEVLRRHAEIEPHRVHIHLLEEDSGQDISYRQLLETASSVAAGLTGKGLKRNETVAIMLPTCADFFYAFFGVMLAGGVAVPIYPPARLDKIEEYVRRQVAILRNAEVRFLVSFHQVKGVTKIMGVKIPSLIETTTVEALREAGAAGSRVAVEPSDTAFIQYTSGSTGDPKGVVLSQANVLANVRGIGHAVKFRPTDVVVSWLPLYHDMGLIGSWLFSAYFGAPITVMSPLAFLSRPERWLWALHDSRGTLCPAPNFAYELCARKIPDEAIEGLDLSPWRIAINAGEAVLPDTLRRFEERFTPYGFRAESFVPCYGLAESSVALAFPPIDRRPVVDSVRRDALESEGRAAPAEPSDASGVLRFVSNGAPLPGHEIRVLDSEGKDLGERVQGRIVFRGPSRTAGYYRNPAATAAVMTDGWMDSGDLGYWANGEIVVTGRVKDLIIKGGHNLVPQEIERAAAEVPGVRRGCVAAFGARDASTGTEKLVVAAETRATGEDERRRIETDIIRRVDAAAGTPPDKVLLVGPQSIPKTSSGKIRRNQTRLLYESGKLGGGKRSPWVQIARLWLSNLGAWLDRGAERAAARALRAYSSSLLVGVSTVAGFLEQLAPGRALAAGIARSAARSTLWLSGHRVALQGFAHAAWRQGMISGEPPGRGAGAILMANRAGRFDALVFAAVTPLPLLVADRTAFEGMPAKTVRMLEPLLVPALGGERTPPGGTLRERLRSALEEEGAVLVLAEGAPGTAPHLSRFRLDAIHAAVSTASPIVPVGVRGTSRILQPGGGRVRRGEASIVAGEPIEPESDDQRELVALREQVRAAIAELCR